VNTIATFPTLADAHALRLALEAQGIAAVVLGEHSVGFIGGGVAVAVSDPSELQSAQAILHDYTRRQTIQAEPPSSSRVRPRPRTVVATLWIIAVLMFFGLLDLLFWH